MRRSLLTLLLAAPLAGCPLDPIACDTSAYTSVVVHVSEEGGGAVDATVTFSVDGGEFADCMDNGDGAWACGWEQAGDITIRVEAASHTTFEETVTVEQGECHVVTQTVDAALVPVDCTMEEVPSVIATVVGSSGEELTGVVARWTHPETGVVADCDGGVDDTWVCGAEVAGAIVVTAVADGHAEESVTVEVGEDECHVITESVEIALDWLPD
jgi:hypothetical protein